MEELLSRISINAQSSIRIDGQPRIYLDPFKIEGSSHDADLIFFTHPHYDHFSPDDFRKVAQDGTTYVAPLAMRDDLLKAGIPASQTTLLQPGETVTVRGIPVEAVPAYNVHKPMHRQKFGWLGYVLTLDGVRVYDAGDIDDIPEGVATGADVALVPIGGTFTMNAREAAGFVNRMRPQVAIPIHYGTIVGKPADARRFQDLVDGGIRVVTKLSFQ